MIDKTSSLQLPAAPPFGFREPTELQEALLRAALLSSDEAALAWQFWCSRVDLENDHIDQGGFRLLPLVYRNLAQYKTALPEMSRLAGIYKQSWYRHQLLWRASAKLLDRFADAGVRTLVLKAIPLGATYYHDMGARPVNDAAILVREGQFNRAATVLEDSGWRAGGYGGEAVPGCFDVIDSMEFRYEQSIGTNTHIRVYRTKNNDALENDIWQTAVRFNYQGLKSETLSPEHHLLNTCAHVVAWSPSLPIQWIADATRIISRGDIKWDQLVDSAIAYDLHGDIVGNLAYLKHRWAQPIPEDVVERLMRAPMSSGKKQLLFNLSRHSRSYLGGMLRLWTLYRYYCLSNGRQKAVFRIAGFPRFVMRLRGVRSFRRFLVLAVNKLTLRSRRYLKRQIIRGSPAG